MCLRHLIYFIKVAGKSRPKKMAGAGEASAEAVIVNSETTFLQLSSHIASPTMGLEMPVMCCPRHVSS